MALNHTIVLGEMILLGRLLLTRPLDEYRNGGSQNAPCHQSCE